MLNPDNFIDLFALHYVYGPLIQAALTDFADTWNNHRMARMHGATPWQRFSAGFGCVSLRYVV
jgi:hypothetical protein